MKAEIAEVLNDIPELAWVSVERRGVHYIPPRLHLREHTSIPVLQYLKDYAAQRPFEGEFFLCLYDGWREYSKAFDDPDFIHWRDVDQSRFAGCGSMGESRFRHLDSNGVFPVLPLPVLSFCRHMGDKSTLLIPDPHFLTGEMKKRVDEVEKYDRAWQEKRSDKLFWRGRKHVYHCPEQLGMHHREYITTSRVRHIDAAYSSNTLIAVQLRNKFLLDADGYVSAWSGLFWKLASNSLPVKLTSHWEQWYYPHLRDRENIVLTDFDLDATYHWLTENDAMVEEIANAGKKLTSMLTYEFACDEYVIA